MNGKQIFAWLGVLGVIAPPILALFGLDAGQSGQIAQCIAALIGAAAAFYQESPEALTLLPDNLRNILAKVSAALASLTALAPFFSTLPDPWGKVLTTAGSLGMILAAYVHDRPTSTGSSSAIALVFVLLSSTAASAQTLTASTAPSSSSSVTVSLYTGLQAIALRADSTYNILHLGPTVGVRESIGRLHLAQALSVSATNEAGKLNGHVGVVLLVGLPLPVPGVAVGVGYDFLRIGAGGGFEAPSLLRPAGSSPPTLYLTVTGKVAIDFLVALLGLP